MSRYKMSNGQYIDKSTLDFRIREAKKKKIENHMDLHGYLFCTTCRQNDCKPIDVAHVISVDECQKTGRAELAYNLSNLVIEGRECHKKRDKLTINYK